MEHIKKAMAEANVTDAELTNRAKVLIKNYQAKVRGINLLASKGGKSEKAEDEANELKEAVVDEIFSIAEIRDRQIREHEQKELEQKELERQQEFEQKELERQHQKKKSGWGNTTTLI